MVLKDIGDSGMLAITTPGIISIAIIALVAVVLVWYIFARKRQTAD